tara:strand:+ start:1021 stop:1974 length:954 start_codon:yes stop_codon:yes gene_type:complete
MGNSNNYRQSNIDINNDIAINTHKTQIYNDRYNLIPSLPGHEYNLIDINNLNNLGLTYNIEDKLDNYVDLRTNFPNIINIKDMSLNPIASVTYMIHYSMLKCKLPIFPPSMIFIFNNVLFYRNSKNIINFDSIFQSIQNFGFCSENELHSIYSNLNIKPPNHVYERAIAFKFINVFKVDNNLTLLKSLIKNKYPILVGFTVYYNLENISVKMWLPDKNKDTKKGGLSGVLVGYIEEQKMFIMAQTFGESFGTSGFILIPYDYILDDNYTFEKYILDFDSNRVESYINQRKKMINLDSAHSEKKNVKYKEDKFNTLFE